MTPSGLKTRETPERLPGSELNTAFGRPLHSFAVRRAERYGYRPPVVKVIDNIQRSFASAQLRALGILRRSRANWRWFDHLARAYGRYSKHHGDQMAAALTFFAFLAFFPLLAIAYALLGYAAGQSDQFRQYLIDAISNALPGISDQLDVAEIASAKTSAGVIGLLALGWTGLGWVGALRTSIRSLWAQDPAGAGN